MMRLTILFGVAAGGIIAAGRMTSAQWHAAGAALLALTLAHGLTVLPWLLAALFAWRYWRWKRTALDWISFGKAQIAAGQTLREMDLRAHEEAARRAAARPQRRKRAAR